MASKFGYLDATTTVFMLCDIQEKIRLIISHFEETLTVAVKMVKGAKMLDIPLIVSEQYAKALGSTVSELDVKNAFGGVISKSSCSMLVPELVKMFENELKHVKSCVLFGHEAHACIEQTAMDLLSLGKEVHIVADASSSRSRQDRILAFERLGRIGCFITTCESLMFKFVPNKTHPKCFEIRELLRYVSPDSEIVSPICSHYYAKDLISLGKEVEVDATLSCKVELDMIRILMASNLGFLHTESSVVMVCDIQEKIKNVISHYEETIAVAVKMIEATKVLEIPTIVTEQYPKGLGHTISELDVKHALGGVITKTKFSMFCPEVQDLFQNQLKHIQTCILFGYETHVCIEQTAMDLISRGLQVHVVADATSSRTKQDRLLAFQRLGQIGCHVTTSESVLFKLIGDKNHPKFNQIRDLVKTPSPDSQIVH
uniref:Isochorismatase domain-containing protein 1 n=1 Tax=Strigamia maritima TaxID=126957 RepID=T1J0E0_STRMM